MEVRPWVNIPFLIQWEKVAFLEETLRMLNTWDVKEKKVILYLNATLEDIGQLIEKIWSINNEILIELLEVGEKPMFLPWEHKKYLPDFLESDFTHFIYLDGDETIPFCVLEYWVETREFLNKHGYDKFIPGTFRIERYKGVDYASDLTYRTNIDKLPIIKISNRSFFVPQEPFQSISIMDKELAREHLNSPCYLPCMDQSPHKFGFIETCISAYILDNLPEGFSHRVLYPIDDYEKCWVYHLPANYAANPSSEHGKIPAYGVFEKIKGGINGNL